MLQKGQNLPHHAAAPHNPSVVARHHKEIGHAAQTRALHGDFAVVWAGEYAAESAMNRAVGGNDAEREMSRPQLLRQTPLPGAELAACRAENPAARGAFLEAIRQFAAMIGRRQHDDSAEVRDGMTGQIVPQNNAAQ